MEKIIEVKHLSKYYGKSRSVIDLSFSVEKGEIFGFIGPNGAGKSTTIRTLLALIQPTSGTATIFGKDCITHAPTIAEKVGYLPGEVYYYDKMRVRELLLYSASFYGKNCVPNIDRLCKRLDLDQNKRIETLSLGNKKKVGIVQGLIHEPELIILDEPTTGLDPLMQQTFFDILKEENEKGATVLFSSHILSEVQKICSRVAIIREGRLVSIEDIAALKQKQVLGVSFEYEGEEAPDLADLPGVSEFTVDHNLCKLVFQGDVNVLVSTLANINLVSLHVEEPSLESIFMHYYSAKKDHV